MLTFGSLFSGIGGFDLGLERAGLVCRWQVEIDAAASGVLACHWPGVDRHGDVRLIGAGKVEPVDVICGGFPCQDVSVAGKRAGLAGERSGLWWEFHRILDELRPAWVVIENVPGLLSSNAGRDFAAILRGLVELRYGVCWRVLDAQYFGVAQRRRRVFIVGHLGDGRAAEILFEREGGGGDTPPSREAGQRVAAYTPSSFGDYRQDIGTLRAEGGDYGGGSEMLIAPTLAAHAPRNNSANETLVAYGGNNTAGPIDVATAQNAHGGTGRIDFESETFVAHTLTANYGKQVDSSDTSKGPPNIVITHTLRGEGHDASEDVTGRGVPMVSQPIRSNVYNNSDPGLDSGMHIQSAIGVRRLMPVECERLQGFPDGWTDGQADSSRYRQLGNAVAVPVAEWLGHRLIATIVGGNK